MRERERTAEGTKSWRYLSIERGRYIEKRERSF